MTSHCERCAVLEAQLKLAKARIEILARTNAAQLAALTAAGEELRAARDWATERAREQAS